jgi:hypothetical protein
MLMQVVVRDWGEAVMYSFTDALTMFLAAIPKIIGFVIILIIGWFVAGLLAKAVAALLRTVQFNELAQKAGFADFVQKMGVGTDSSGFIALITKWFVRLITLVVAFDALGLPAVSEVLRELLLWLPNLVVALVVLVIGGLAANALSSLVRGAAARSELGNPELLATIARIAVWAFAIVIAINQIGIASGLVNTLFTATVGAVALALGLSFGLGGRDTAAKIVSGWYEQSQRIKSNTKEFAQNMKKEVEAGTNEPLTTTRITETFKDPNLE